MNARQKSPTVSRKRWLNSFSKQLRTIQRDLTFHKNSQPRVSNKICSSLIERLDEAISKLRKCRDDDSLFDVFARTLNDDLEDYLDELQEVEDAIEYHIKNLENLKMAVSCHDQPSETHIQILNQLATLIGRVADRSKEGRRRGTRKLELAELHRLVVKEAPKFWKTTGIVPNVSKRSNGQFYGPYLDHIRGIAGSQSLHVTDAQIGEVIKEHRTDPDWRQYFSRYHRPAHGVFANIIMRGNK